MSCMGLVVVCCCTCSRKIFEDSNKGGEFGRAMDVFHRLE